MSTNAFVKQLIESVYKGTLQVTGTASIITVKVEDRAKVKADLYKALDKKKYAYEDVKTTKSSFNVTQLKTPEGKAVQIIYKNATGGGGSGAGAEVTELAESAQCWYTAVAFNHTINSFDDFAKYKDKVKSKCETDATLEKIVDKLPDDWVDSSIKIANYMKGMAEFKSRMKQYRFHRGSTLVEKISEMFLSANRKEQMFANINKWSPADIWLMTPAGEAALASASTDQTFASLNAMITRLYESRDLIGVSLKKVGQAAHHEVFNHERNATKSAFKSFKISDKSKDGYILFQYKDDPNMSIQFRSFSDSGSWQGEIKGKYASGGKIGGGQVAAIMQRVGGPRLASSDAKTITVGAQARHTKIIDGIKAFAKKVGVANLVDPKVQSSDWLYSKYLTLELFSAVKGLTKAKQEHFLREVVGYAASSTENSAVFIKIS